MPCAHESEVTQGPVILSGLMSRHLGSDSLHMHLICLPIRILFPGNGENFIRWCSVDVLDNALVHLRERRVDPQHVAVLSCSRENERCE
jgi:hypothetical protein